MSDRDFDDELGDEDGEFDSQLRGRSLTDYANDHGIRASQTTQAATQPSNWKKFRNFLGSVSFIVGFIIVLLFFVVLGWFLRVGYVVNSYNVPAVETGMAYVVGTTPTDTPTETQKPTDTPIPTFTPTITPSPSDTPTNVPTEAPTVILKAEGSFWVDVLVMEKSDELCLSTVSTVFSLDLVSEIHRLGLFGTEGAGFTLSFMAGNEARFYEEGVIIFENLDPISLDQGHIGLEDLSLQVWSDPDIDRISIDIHGLDESLYQMGLIYDAQPISGSVDDGCTVATEVTATPAQAATLAPSATSSVSPSPTATLSIVTPSVRCEPHVSIEQVDAVMWAIFIRLENEPVGCQMPPAGYIQDGNNRTRGNQSQYEIASLLSSTGQQLYTNAIEDGFTGKISVVGQPPFVANGFHFTYQPTVNPVSSVVVRFLGSSDVWEFTVTPTIVPLPPIQVSPSPTASWTPSATATPSLTLPAANTVAAVIVTTSEGVQSAATELIVSPTFIPLPTEEPSVQVIIGPESSGGQVNRSITLTLSAELAEEIHRVTGNNSVNCRITFRNSGNIVYDEVLLNPSITVNSSVGQPVNSGMSINFIQPITTAIVICHNRDEWRFVVSIEIQN